jgi:hypothetical protein
MGTTQVSGQQWSDEQRIAIYGSCERCDAARYASVEEIDGTVWHRLRCSVCGYSEDD